MKVDVHPTTQYTLECVLCQKENDETKTSTYCTFCADVLSVRYHKTSPAMQVPLKAYQPDPLKHHLSTLTQLPRLSKTYDIDLWAKLEFEHPSGCFKDRGSAIEVQKALELGRDAICLASTGNMAASVAMYASYYNLPCFVFVPEQTSEAKLAQATIYNATILRVQGDFAKCEELCKEFALSGNVYLAGDYVFREEGQKDFSYELLAQGVTDFDAIAIPVGCGTNFAAIYKGYAEMKAAGLVDRIPQLLAIQPEASSPVVEGIFKREKVVKELVQTIATSVAVANPFDFHKVLHAIDETDGKAYTVTENDILGSLREMAVTEGHFTEPACALPLAAMKDHSHEWQGKKVLLVLTGSGLKDTRVVAKHSLTPPVLEPTIEAIQEYVGSGFVEMQKRAWGKARSVVLADVALSDTRDKVFNSYVEAIQQRGKTLQKHEIEALQSIVLQEKEGVPSHLEVLDYTVTMRKEGLVEASVKLRLHGVEVESETKGVGPVDAVLAAIRTHSDTHCKILVKNHEVDILSPQTDSLVVVTLTLEHEGRQIRPKGASSDTLEAVIHAFEKGYSVLAEQLADQKL